MDTFFDYFRENMESLGLPAPAALYGNLATAVSTAATLSALVDKFGTRVTVAELAGAGLRAEKFAVAGAITASYYVGAVIGSLAVAAGRSISGGTSLTDVLSFAGSVGLQRPWLARTLTSNPRLYARPAHTTASAATP